MGSSLRWNDGTPLILMADKSLEKTLMRAWMRRGLLACALWPVSLVFRALAALRYRLYRAGIRKAERLPVPVVVAGNVFVGGTGKTPLTIWLAESLRAAGFTPGVISRGYGSESIYVREVTRFSSAAEVGDEPLLIAQRTGCPGFVGRQRVDAGRALLEAHPKVDVIISDDGLQHYPLARDVEIVLFDSRGAGNGWLLPAGPLREPASRRRDFTIVNAPEITAKLARQVGGQAYRMQLGGSVAVRLSGVERSPLASFARKRVLAAAGIGNPARFFATLRGAGLTFDELPLPDHYDFLEIGRASCRERVL